MSVFECAHAYVFVHVCACVYVCMCVCLEFMLSLYEYTFICISLWLYIGVHFCVLPCRYENFICTHTSIHSYWTCLCCFLKLFQYYIWLFTYWSCFFRTLQLSLDATILVASEVAASFCLNLLHLFGLPKCVKFLNVGKNQQIRYYNQINKPILCIIQGR